jgi:hypothetical protein
MADLDELALAMPQATKTVSDDGRPAYPAVLMRVPALARIDRDELADLVAEAWLTRAQKRLAKAWLDEQRT